MTPAIPLASRRDVWMLVRGSAMIFRAELVQPVELFAARREVRPDLHGARAQAGAAWGWFTVSDGEVAYRTIGVWSLGAILADLGFYGPEFASAPISVCPMLESGHGEALRVAQGRDQSLYELTTGWPPPFVPRRRRLHQGDWRK